MSLEDAIAEAIANADPPPPNESTTCEWVIYPLLLAAGYARREIISRIADNGGQFPDYTLLPDTPHTWYLEAKAWSVPLQDNHAQQALNYANQNGKRWVVLTNGREWRLYDNLVQGVAADKLAHAAMLSAEGEFAAFLSALARPRVISGELCTFVAKARLKAYLIPRLSDETSDLVRAMAATARRNPGLASVRPVDVSCANSEIITGTPDVESVVPGPTVPAPKPPASLGGAQPLTWLREHTSECVTGNEPSLLTLPDGSTVAVRYWKDLAREVVVYLVNHGHSLPLPFRGRKGGKCYFANTSPMHAVNPMRSSVKVTGGGRDVYLDTWRSASELVHNTCSLCEAVGEAPDGFLVTLGESQPPSGC